MGGRGVVIGAFGCKICIEEKDKKGDRLKDKDICEQKLFCIFYLILFKATP